MPKPSPVRPITSATRAIPAAAPPSIARLLTRAQVIERIKLDIAKSSLTEVAARHEISPQQLSDLCYGRANLSKKMLQKLRYVLHEYYEKVG